MIIFRKTTYSTFKSKLVILFLVIETNLKQTKLIRMNTELIEKSPTQREIKIEIEPDAVREVYNKVSQKYAKQANVPVFAKDLRRSMSCVCALRMK